MKEKKIEHGLLYYVSQYKELDNLLAYISQKEIDSEAIKKYIECEYDTVELAKSEGREISYDTIPQCIKEGREVLKLKPFPWEWIRSSANGIGYYTPEEANIYSKEELAKRWLTFIIDALEKEAIKAGKLQAQKKAG